MIENIKKYYFIIAFTISLVVISGAYIIEFFYNFPPCELCIYQRIPYFFVLSICIVSFFMKYKNIYTYLIFFFFFASFLIAFFHSLVERGIIEYSSSCTSSVSNFESIEDLRMHLDSVSLTKCDEILFSVMGFSLANINTMVSLSLVLFNIYFVWRLNDSKKQKTKSYFIEKM